MRQKQVRPPSSRGPVIGRLASWRASAHESVMPSKNIRPRRSVLYMPASNQRALAKLPDLACDAVIIDLEDAVAPEEKTAARDRLRKIFAARPLGREMVVRINALSSEWGRHDLAAASACAPDAILLPKVETKRDILDAVEALEAAGTTKTVRLWAMVETPKVMLNLAAIAELGRSERTRLDCLVAGTNDLVKETRIRATPDRRYLAPWLLQMVLAARAGGLDILDGVSNDFRDLAAFGQECEAARAMGFDGKTLIHPAQIGPANEAFAPSASEMADAKKIVEAFALAENAGRGAIALDGRMVERLHLVEAERLLAQAAAIRDIMK
jgi:citrate lyase subunit beta / citryl-CoA lyase